MPSRKKAMKNPGQVLDIIDAMETAFEDLNAAPIGGFADAEKVLYDAWAVAEKKLQYMKSRLDSINARR